MAAGSPGVVPTTYTDRSIGTHYNDLGSNTITTHTMSNNKHTIRNSMTGIVLQSRLTLYFNLGLKNAPNWFYQILPSHCACSLACSIVSQLLHQVKAAAGGSCSVEAFVHAQHL